MIKEFKDIGIRKMLKKDLNHPERFQDFINSLVEEDAKILVNTKKTKAQEYDWIKQRLKAIREKKAVTLVAEHNNKIVGSSSVRMGIERQSRLGTFGISVRKEYRGIGLGKVLSKGAIKLAKKELKVRVIELHVFESNKIAINLYKKIGFKEVAKLPKQIEYKGKLVSEIVMMM